MPNLHLIKRQKLFNQSQSYFNDQNQSQLPFDVQTYPYRSLIVYEKRGHWSEKQRLKYVIFIEHFKERFEIQAKRRFSNVFELMARFIKTRNSYQCRSHHQKMEKQKFKIDSIIFNISSKYHPRVYQQLRQKYTPQIISLNKNLPQDFELFKQKSSTVQMKTREKQEYAPTERVLRSKYKKVKKNQNKYQIEQNIYQETPNDKQYQLEEQIPYDRVKIQNQEEVGGIFRHSFQQNIRNQQRNMRIQNPSWRSISNHLSKESERYKQNGHYHFIQFNHYLSKAEQCYAAMSYLLQAQRRKAQTQNQKN